MSNTDKPDTNLTGNASADNPADLAGAYALNALNADETAEYERYLARSEQARIEAAELSDTAVALGLAVAPVQPSSALKANLMAQIASTPQLAPLAASATPTTVDPARPVETAATTDAPAAVIPIGTTTPSGPAATAGDAPAATPSSASAPGALPSAGSGSAGSASERAQRRWFQRPAGYLVAAAAAVAIFAGGTFTGQALFGGSADQSAKQAASLAEINAAADSQRASTETAGGQEATLVWSGELGLSAIIVEDLPALGDDEDYQLWYIGEGGPVAAGTFDSDGSGTVWRVLDGTMSAGDAVGVTVEPAGGSDQPTSDPIVAIQS